MALISVFNIFNIETLATKHVEDVNMSFVPIYQIELNPLEQIFLVDNVLIRAVFGTKISMYLGFLTIALMVPIAIFLGSIAGYYGGVLDDAITVYFKSVIYSVPDI
jgi:ABC-type microcin C transport system permease subunit YejE